MFGNLVKDLCVKKFWYKHLCAQGAFGKGGGWSQGDAVKGGADD